MAIITSYPSSFTNPRDKATYTNLGNAYANDGIYATITSADNNSTHYVQYAGFDFSSIPLGSVINSISVEVEYKFSVSSAPVSMSIQAYNGNSTVVGTAITDANQPTIDTIVTNADIGTWDITSLGNIQVRVNYIRPNTKTSRDMYIDYVGVTVDYSAPLEAIIDVPVVTASGMMYTPTLATESKANATTMTGTAHVPVPLLIMPISLVAPEVGQGTAVMLIPTVSSQSNVMIRSTVPTAIVSTNIPELKTDNILAVPVSTVTARSFAPDISIKYDILIQTPVSNATATMLIPFRETTAKLMTMDSLLNLAVLGEVVEGSVVNLDKYGVLTIVEIVEGSVFNLSPNGVLTVNSITEMG